MKKFIIILSALLVMSASLYACNNGENEGEEGSTTGDRIVIDQTTGGNGESASETGTISENESTTSETEEGTKVYTFEERNETVYVISSTGAVNVRSDTVVNDSTIVKSVENGTELKRTGISTDGEWSRIEFEGKTCYVKSLYLTTMKDPDAGFTAVEKTLYLNTESLIARLLPSTDSEIMAYLVKGEKISIIAENDESGWYKIHYKGKYVEGDFYISSDDKYFSTEEITTVD